MPGPFFTLELTQAGRVVLLSPLHSPWTGADPSGSGHVLFHNRSHHGLELTQAGRVMFLFTTRATTLQLESDVALTVDVSVVVWRCVYEYIMMSMFYF